MGNSSVLPPVKYFRNHTFTGPCQLTTSVIEYKMYNYLSTYNLFDNMVYWYDKIAVASCQFHVYLYFNAVKRASYNCQSNFLIEPNKIRFKVSNSSRKYHDGRLKIIMERNIRKRRNKNSQKLHSGDWTFSWKLKSSFDWVNLSHFVWLLWKILLTSWRIVEEIIWSPNIIM